MSTYIRRLKLCVILVTVGIVASICVGWQWPVKAASEAPAPSSSQYNLPFGPNPFAPSNARTTTGEFIEPSKFIPASRCVNCHKDTHREWSQSAHRNSFREPFYQANVKHLIRERGIAVTRHCESCHNPVALFSGALTPNAKMARPFDEEGVSCSVCHGIVSTTTKGIGSYTIAPPALLVKANGERLHDATDAEVWDDLPAHRRAVMRPLLRTPEFCAACHKAAVTPELNGRKWLRSFAVYDEWQQSAFSRETVQPLSRRDNVETCQSCHMPKASMPKAVASHRWPGGNTAIPAHYRWPDQVSATEALLKSGVVTVDVFAMRSDDAIEDPTAPLDVKKPELKPGQAITVDIVVANRGVGHAFPAELRDIFEAWLEFEAKDASGKVLMHSGAVKADGTLEPEAHAYRTTLVDTHGELSTKHDIWNTRAVALDRHIPAGRADIGRFTFIVPPGTLSPIVLTARLNYRRFNRNFTDWVSRDTPVMKSPVVKMSEHAVSLPLAGKRQPLRAAFLATDNSSLRKRWRAYGVALFDQQQYEGAASAFERARTLALVSSTDEASSDIDLAVTLMRMERAGSSQSVLDQAGRAIAHAIEINPEDGRARFYRALLNVKRFRYTEAIADLETLARKQPRDRQVWTQLAAIYLLQRRDQEAQAAYEQVLRIDPDDTEANFKLSGLFWRFGIYDLAKSSQDKFQPRHADTAGETLRRDYLRSHPELSATWPWRQFGDNPIGSLP